MKTAIYIENGDTQAVLTPENDWEKQVLNTICPKRYDVGYETGASMMPSDVTALRGDFYECRGGWYRQATTDNSLIFRIRKEKETRIEPPTDTKEAFTPSPEAS